MRLLSAFNGRPRLTDAQVDALCTQFEPEIAQICSGVQADVGLPTDNQPYLGILGLLGVKKPCDSPISPIVEASVYLAYKKWDLALKALERTLRLRDHELVVSGVDRPRAQLEALLQRMEQAAAKISLSGG